jgi:hypothetical protein
MIYSFAELSRGFMAFDLLWLNSRDLRERPLLERKERLRSVDSTDNVATEYHANAAYEIFALLYLLSNWGIRFFPRADNSAGVCSSARKEHWIVPQIGFFRVSGLVIASESARTADLVARIN